MSGPGRLACAPPACALLASALLAGCGGPAAPTAVYTPHVPPFATVPYEPFSRQSVVAIALREWRLFGSGVFDDPPGTPELQGEDKPERQPGLWQRVGEYWWESQNPSSPTGAWTGRHDAQGMVFPSQQDGDYAWSAAFVSYVMRVAGAGPRFPYAPSHSTYINLAVKMAQGATQGWDVTAERPDAYAPQPGDLICYGRNGARDLRFDDLPAGAFTSHCDIVIGPTPQGLDVIGGNVRDAVTMKHVPIDSAGRLAAPGGAVYDTRYPWMVVLRLTDAL